MPDYPTWKILLVEDSEDLRTLIKLSLEDILGSHIQVAYSGHAGVQSAKLLQPDIILLDLDTNGFPVLQMLKNEPSLKDIPVVLLSCRVRLRDELESYKLGASTIIQKPFDPLSLRQIVSNIITSLSSEELTG